MHRRNGWLLIVAAVAWVSLLAGCGVGAGGGRTFGEELTTLPSASEPTPKAAAEPGGTVDDPCDMLAVTEVEEVLGVPMVQGTSESGNCLYGGEPPNESTGVAVGTRPVLEDLHEEHELLVKGMGRESAQPVDGLGQAATAVFGMRSGLPSVGLAVTTSGTHLVIAVVAPEDHDLLGNATQFAHIALGRLP